MPSPRSGRLVDQEAGQRPRGSPGDGTTVGKCAMPDGEMVKVDCENGGQAEAWDQGLSGDQSLFLSLLWSTLPSFLSLWRTQEVKLES